MPEQALSRNTPPDVIMSEAKILSDSKSSPPATSPSAQIKVPATGRLSAFVSTTATVDSRPIDIAKTAAVPPQLLTNPAASPTTTAAPTTVPFIPAYAIASTIITPYPRLKITAAMIPPITPHFGSLKSRGCWIGGNCCSPEAVDAGKKAVAATMACSTDNLPIY